MSNNHLIHQLILDLNLNSETQDLGEINEEINRYKSEILEIITEYFNSLDIAENILIDDLKIDLGKFSTIDELRAKIVEQLDSQLNEILKTQNSKAQSYSESFNQILIEKSSENNPLSIVLYFLKTGTYLWDFQKIDFKNKNSVEVYSKILLKYIQQNSTENLLKTIIDSPSIFWRLHFYFPKLTLKLIEKITTQESAHQELIKKIRKDFLLVFSKTHSLFSQESWQQFFKIVLANYQRKINNETSFTYLILIIIKKEIVFSNEIIFDEKQSKIQFSISSDDRKLIAKYLSEGNDSVIISENQLFFETEIHPFLKDIPEKNMSTNEEEYLEKPENSLQKLLPNCGIIFLHAYLKPFFEAQGLLQNKKFKNRKSQIKAIQLLHYLATYKVDFKDNSELFFLKLLIEIPTADFITFPKPLTKKEKTECEIIMQNLIEHWTVLKKTSIQTLQNQFIQRKGLVSMEEKSIEIHLEKSGVDILLEHFPFNYSMIKLPWMKRLIIMIL